MQPVERTAGPVTDHGGNLAAARRRFPDAVQPWIDLSTGISPFPYPYSPLPATAFERLPEPGDEAGLRTIAAKAYGAPAAANVVAASGTQSLLPVVFGLQKPGRAVVLGPTYAEHERVAALCGHDCRVAQTLEELAVADLAVVVNPNNPDGRVVSRADLSAVAAELALRGGLLVVDEAFMDVGPNEESICRDVESLPLVVLRSFGKFHGLAGIRLGFAIASAAAAEAMQERLGPWAVSGPALSIGTQALADSGWREGQRRRLADNAERLKTLLRSAGLDIAGGTELFQLVRHPEAHRLHDLLGQNGILTRAFGRDHEILRMGLPGDEAAWGRLTDALGLFVDSGKE